MNLEVVAHDFPLLFPQSRDFSPFWSIAWDYMGAGGIGASALKTMWIDLYANFVYFASNFAAIPWWLSQRIFWIIPFFLISILSSYKFSGLFVRRSIYRALSAIIYTFNTYILLIIGGGQFGIAFSYALAPLVLFALFRLFEQTSNRSLLISSLLSGLLIALDPRLAFLTFGIAALWYLFIVRDFSTNRLKFVLANFLIAGLLNSYWILPAFISVLSNSSPSVSNYFSLPGVKFLSFATFENSFSFLHPNWPENIFGKIYFQRPEFLLLPILAFSSLLFIKHKIGSTIEQLNNRTITFFVFLALLGAFLGKGANEPFGQIYLYLFKVPGFNLFRDPTKFYLLISLSYSILIPFTVSKVFELLKSKKQFSIFNFQFSIKSKFQISNVFLLFTILYLLFLLRPFWSGQLTGIFKPQKMPIEYIKLADFLKNDKQFSRTLWIPERQKYGYFDPTHPAADFEVLFAKRNISEISEEEFTNYSIKYVIVPTDPESEIFLKDRKYDEKARERTIRRVDSLGLHPVVGLDNLAIYQTQSSKGHFWSPSTTLRINYKFVNPTEYEVSVKNARKGDILVFSEGYDKNWELASQGLTLKGYALKFGEANSFVFPQDGDYELEIKYRVQDWVNIGLIVSALTTLALIIASVRLAKKGKN